MRKIIFLLMLIFSVCFCSLLITATAEQEHFQTNDFEYTVSGNSIEVLAYHGTYLPRELPTQLDGYSIFLEYSDPIFTDLVQDYGIYRYGLVAEDEAYIVGYKGYQQIAFIPESINGVPVTGIGDLAFWLSGCERDEFAEVVIVPGSIRSIGRRAFSCTGIGYIVLQEGLERIGDLAFEGHSQIHMNIPDSVKEMGMNPFADHVDLGYVNGYLFPSLFHNEFFAIDDTGHLLYGKEDMRVITYRSNLQPQWNSSTTCTVPDGIKVIGKRAFYADPYLTEVILPNSLQVIEAEAVLYCYELSRVIIPEGVTTIGDYAFAETAMVELEIPSSVTAIGDGIFHDWAPGEATIRCDAGSFAEEYAKANGYQIQYR